MNLKRLQAKYFMFAGLWLLAQLVYLTPATAAQVKIIPNEAEYSAFLLNGWRAERPNVLVFKDPFCPYCIKAIPKLDHLNGYNVYVFWAPILGEASQKRVAQLFNCERLASQTVLSAVSQRKSPNCTPNSAQSQQVLKQLNDKLVNNYKINAVPSFFIQGKNVSLSKLLTMQNQRPMINGVNIRWQTFELMKYTNFYDAKNLVMYVPNKQSAVINQLLDKYQPEYLFLESELIEQNAHLVACPANDKNCLSGKNAAYKNKLAEFKLLMGHSLFTGQAVIFNMAGKQIH